MNGSGNPQLTEIIDGLARVQQSIYRKRIGAGVVVIRWMRESPPVPSAGELHFWRLATTYCT